MVQGSFSWPGAKVLSSPSLSIWSPGMFCVNNSNRWGEHLEDCPMECFGWQSTHPERVSVVGTSSQSCPRRLKQPQQSMNTVIKIVLSTPHVSLVGHSIHLSGHHPAQCIGTALEKCPAWPGCGWGAEWHGHGWAPFPARGQTPFPAPCFQKKWPRSKSTAPAAGQLQFIPVLLRASCLGSEMMEGNHSWIPQRNTKPKYYIQV